jgi:hypothetical protein
MPNGFPGWATKFFLDALLHQHDQDRAAAPRIVTQDAVSA